jgi:Ca2+-binding RTX toxin-like protein
MAVFDTWVSFNMTTPTPAGGFSHPYDFGQLFDGVVAVNDGSEYTIIHGGGTGYDQFYGAGLYVGSDVYGRPLIGGTVGAIYTGGADINVFDVGLTGVSIPFADIWSAALTSSLADDFALFKRVLAGNDTVKGSDYGDILTGFTGNDNVHGYSGNDTVYGDAGNDTLNGGWDNDTVKGDAGIDNVRGDLGNDNLYGGVGIDTLRGDAGYDKFFFNTAPSSTNYDRIADFYAPQDTIVLENAIFRALTATGTLAAALFWKSTTGIAHDANDRIIYETDTGYLNYDSNGNAAGGAIRFASSAPICQSPTLIFL